MKMGSPVAVEYLYCAEPWQSLLVSNTSVDTGREVKQETNLYSSATVRSKTLIKYYNL